MTVLGALARIRDQLSIVTRLGWSVVAVATALWLISYAAGWTELRVAAAALIALVLLSVLRTMGGVGLQLELSVQPIRMRAAAVAEGRLQVANPTARPIRSATVHLPVGALPMSFAVPRLAAGARHTDEFPVAATHRGVITVGPVATVRGDPFGLAERVVEGSAALEVFVHPEIVPLPALDAGLVRDLEGRPTTDPSASDLDFHTLRSYAPGDERRHIHWRSSARASAARGSTTLLIKGYTDTRRSHLGVVLDARSGRYADEDAFEAAVVAAASVTVRALRDEMDVTVIAGDHAMDRVGIAHTLDGYSRVQPVELSLPELTGRLASLAPTTSIALIVTGAEHPFAQLRRATAQFGPSVRVVVLRVALQGASSATSVHGMTVLTLGQLSDLPRLIGIGVLG